MKTPLFALVTLTTLAASAQTGCVNLHYRDTTLCTMSDGGGVLTDYDRDGSFRESRFDPAAWTRLSAKLMQEDTNKIKARIVQLKAAEEQRQKDEAAFYARLALERKAADITSKKPCIAAGFGWSHGQCSIKEEAAK